MSQEMQAIGMPKGLQDHCGHEADQTSENTLSQKLEALQAVELGLIPGIWRPPSVTLRSRP